MAYEKKVVSSVRNYYEITKKSRVWRQVHHQTISTLGY